MKTSTTPNLIIAGVVKGGTTSLFSYLSAHPDICASRIKETCFFHPLRYGTELPDIKNYQRYFSHCSGQKYIMEASPGYFEGGKPLAEALKKYTTTDLKIIIFLRDPTDRLVSFFKYKRSMLELPPDMTLSEYINRCQSMSIEAKRLQSNDMWWGVEGGKYDLYIKDWIDTYGPNLKIIFFDDLKSNAKSVTVDVCKWLNITPEFYETYPFHVENKSTAYKNKFLQKIALYINKKLETVWRTYPAIKTSLRDVYYSINGKDFDDKPDPEVLNKIHQIYAPHNSRLKDILLNSELTKIPKWLSQ